MDGCRLLRLTSKFAAINQTIAFFCCHTVRPAILLGELMQARLLLLKLSATIAALICSGCVPGQITPQPTAEPLTIKLVVDGEGKIKLDGNAKLSAVGGDNTPASDSVCNCGCGKEGCTCDKRQASAAPTLSMREGLAPQIVMLTDFEPGACAACDIAWNDRRGRSYTLTKKLGTGGKTSPTFQFSDGSMWSPTVYTTGDLEREWNRRNARTKLSSGS